MRDGREEEIAASQSSITEEIFTFLNISPTKKEEMKRGITGTKAKLHPHNKEELREANSGENPDMDTNTIVALRKR